MPIMLRSKTSAAALMAAAASFPTCAVVPVEAVMMPIPSRTSTPQPDKAGPPYKDEAAVTTDVPDAVLQIADAAVTTSDVITEAKEAMERANTTKGLAMDSAAKAKGHAEEAIKFANKDDPERYDLTKAQDKLQTAIGEAKAAAAHIEGLRAEVEAAQTQAAAAHIEGLHAEVEAAQTQIQTQTLYLRDAEDAVRTADALILSAKEQGVPLPQEPKSPEVSGWSKVESAGKLGAHAGAAVARKTGQFVQNYAWPATKWTAHAGAAVARKTDQFVQNYAWPAAKWTAHAGAAVVRNTHRAAKAGYDGLKPREAAGTSTATDTDTDTDVHASAVDHPW